MIDLLAGVLDAHGGLDRWNTFQTAKATVISGGELLDRKAPQIPEPRTMTVALHRQWASVMPFGGADRRSDFTWDRIAVETLDGAILAERGHPRASFAGHDLDTPWDPLDRGYFNGYAMWIYMTAPFMFVMPGVAVEEIAPLIEDGEVWRGLQITLPPELASHSTVQRFYFGADLLLRRQDYTLDIAGGANVANYCHDIVETEGIRIPSKRRALLCDDDYKVLPGRVLIWIDFSDMLYA